MLDADEVAELPRIKRDSAYEVIRKINAEQEARGGAVTRGQPEVTSSTPCTSRRWTDMPVYKDDSNGTYYVQYYYRDARGSKRHKTKRGFSSEVEAAVWESQFKSLHGGAMDMTFSDFVKVYASEVKPRIREHTWITKEYIINDKLVPFFGDMRMCDVRPIDVIRWQNELTEHRDADGKPWVPTYLRTVNNQFNAIFNHAERYYGLTDNPVRRVDKIGSKKGGEMQFWTKDEYLRFSEAAMGLAPCLRSCSTDGHPAAASFWRYAVRTSCWRARGCASTSRTRASTAWIP